MLDRDQAARVRGGLSPSGRELVAELSPLSPQYAHGSPWGSFLLFLQSSFTLHPHSLLGRVYILYFP